MVLKNIAIFSLVVFAFIQWTSLQHDIEHMQEVMYVAHCSDEKKDDDKELNHCENCHVFKNLVSTFIDINSRELNQLQKSILNDSYRVFAFTHFYSINSVRGPPHFS